MIQLASELGRSTNPALHLGVCGETAGDPKSIEFYYIRGLDYISCSPYRIPVARLTAAQVNLRQLCSKKK